MMDICSPYPGLRPFRQDENEIFFGRDEQVAALLDKLAQHHFLAVIAPSGYGKSSLVRTGLLNALAGGMLPQAGSYWRIADIHPANAPFQQLAAGLLRESCLRPDYAKALGSTDEELAANLPLLEDSLRRSLRRGPYSLHEIWQQRVTQRPAGSKLLILVDQFEELFRYAEKISTEVSAAFAALLLAAAQHPDIYVILTMRTDFLGHCAQFENLPEAVSQGLYLVPRMDRDQLQEAIEGPAEMFGGEIEPALLNRMLNDLSGQQDQLPLLQHCLMRLWHQAEKEEAAPRLTLQAYERLGGLRRALSDHADEAYRELNPVQQRQAKVMFQALTEQEGGLDTRRPETVGIIAQLLDQDWQVLLPVIGAFRQQGRNFITAASPSVQLGGAGQQHNLNEATLLDISHESLIRQWRRLQNWTKQEAQSAETYRRLCQTAELHQQGKAELLRGVELAADLDWLEKQQPSIAWAKRYGGNFLLAVDFVEQSRQEEETEEQKKKKRRRRTINILTVGLGLISGLAGVNFVQWKNAEENRRIVVQEKEITVKVINNFTTKIFPILKKSPWMQDEIKDILKENIEIIKKIESLCSGNNSGSRAEKTINLIMIGDLSLAAGEIDEALLAYFDALKNHNIPSSGIENKQSYRLYDIYQKIGYTLYIAGRRKESLDYYNKALNIQKSITNIGQYNIQNRKNMVLLYRRIGDIQRYLGKTKKAKWYYERSFSIIIELIRKNQNDVNLISLLGPLLWRLEKKEQAIEAYANALKLLPEDIDLLSGDMELAWLQDDTARCRQHIATLDNLLRPVDPLYSITRFYDWLLDPEASWLPVLTAIEIAGDSKRYGWDFSSTKQKVKKNLPNRPRQAAEAFIDYFEGKINLKDLQEKLDTLQQISHQPSGGNETPPSTSR